MGEMASDALAALLEMCGITIETLSARGVSEAVIWSLPPGAIVTAWAGDVDDETADRG